MPSPHDGSETCATHFVRRFARSLRFVRVDGRFERRFEVEQIGMAMLAGPDLFWRRPFVAPEADDDLLIHVTHPVSGTVALLA